MKINVGSANSVKIDAVKEIISNYLLFTDAEICSIEVSSDVSSQPKSLDETIRGAVNRARNAFNGCNYSFGIESGLMEVPYTKTGYMDVCACAIYDGEKYNLGLSSAFEYPLNVTKFVFDDNLEINDAFFKAGLTDKQKVGSFEGVIGVLTKGRLLRKEYTKQAIQMALIHLDNKNLY